MREYNWCIVVYQHGSQHGNIGKVLSKHTSYVSAEKTFKKKCYDNTVCINSWKSVLKEYYKMMNWNTIELENN